MMRLALLVIALLSSQVFAHEGNLFNFPSCSICPDGFAVTSPELVLPANTAGILISAASCDDIEHMASEGDYSPFACSILRAAVSDDCGCSADDGSTIVPPTDASSTSAPVVSLTSAPTSAPTLMPAVVVVGSEAPVSMMPVMGNATEAPLANATDAPLTSAPTTMPAATVPPTSAPTTMPVATESPTSAPVMAPVDVPSTTEQVSTPLFMQLDNVRGPLTPQGEEAYCAAVEEFLTGKIEGLINLRCVVETTTVVDDERRRRRSLRHNSAADAGQRRHLQEPVSILVQAVIIGDVVGDTTTDDAGFGADVVEAFAEGQEEFASILASEAPFFAGSDVGSVATTDAPVAPAPAPTVPPVTVGEPQPIDEDDDGGLSGGAIFGIILAVVVALACIGAGVYFAGKSGGGAGEPRGASAVTEELETDMLHPPNEFKATKVLSTPVASAAAVAAAATGDPSVIKGESTIAAEGGESSTVGGESSAMSSLKPNMMARMVEAPPGKLGIVIDTTLEGPVVHKISETSPLKGTVFEGDVIVAINDVDTRAMSASAITALMGRTANMRRELTVLSEDIQN